MSVSIGNKIIKLSGLDSTNNYAISQIYANNWDEGVVVQTDFQTGGRGQLGNRWESEQGKNLLCSIVLKPKFVPVPLQFVISKVVSLSLLDLLRNYIENVSVKWPNDVYCGPQKIAGVLIENSILGSVMEYSVIGIGLNVNQMQFLSDAPNPVSMAMLTGKTFDMEVVLKELLLALNRWYGLLCEGEIEQVNEAYARNLYRKGVMAAYRDGKGEFMGTVLGVNMIGQLLIRDEHQQLRQYHFKEVSFL